MHRLLVVLAILICNLSFARQKQQGKYSIWPFPKMEGAIHDFGNFLTPSEEQSLNKELVHYQQSSSNALVVITLDSLIEPQTKKQVSIEETALLFFNTWGIGDSKKNNGVLIMASRNPRRVRIEVGKGLEAILTNAVCKQIIDQHLVPNFKKGTFYTGFREAVQALEKKLADTVSTAVVAGGVNSEADQSDAPVVSNEPIVVSEPFRPNLGIIYVGIGIVVFVILAFVMLVARRVRNANGVFSGNGYQALSGNHTDQYTQQLLQNNLVANAIILSESNNASSSFDSSPSPSFDSVPSASSADSFSGGSSDGGGASGSW